MRKRSVTAEQAAGEVPEQSAEKPAEKPAGRWRYVVLRHDLPPGVCLPTASSDGASSDGTGALDDNSLGPGRRSHFDLMFETPQGLLTWAVEQLPADSGSTQPAIRLPLHRAAYLDYEGSISGNRGTVLRVQAGTYQTLGMAGEVVPLQPLTSSRFAFECQRRSSHGQTICQLLVFDRADDGGWELRSTDGAAR